MTHSSMTYKEITHFIGQAIRNRRLGLLTKEEKRHYKESLENDVFLQIVMHEYHPFVAGWDSLLRTSEQITSQQITSVAHIHDAYFITHKAKGVDFFVEKYGPLDMSDKVERLIDAMRVLGNARQKVCDERLYDALLEQEERNRQITKARELAHERGEAFQESLVELSAPIDMLLERFGTYITKSRKDLPHQTAAIKELIYFGKWAGELSSEISGESEEERAERIKESARRWAVIIEALEESRTAYFLDTVSESYSCAIGLEERLQLKMFYIASATHAGPLTLEQILLEKMIAPFIQRDPECVSVYYPTDLLYQKYLEAADLSIVEVPESFWQRKEKTDLIAAFDFQELFEQYQQEYTGKYNNIKNAEIVQKLLEADFSRVVANAGIGIDLSKKTAFDRVIIEKLYDKKEHTISKLVALKEPQKTAYQAIATPAAEKKILERLSVNLGFTYGFTEMILSILGQQMLLEQEHISASLTGVELLNAYVKEERLRVVSERERGASSDWVKEEAQDKYAKYLMAYTHSTPDKSLVIKFLPTEQLDEKFMLLIKENLLFHSQSQPQDVKNQPRLRCHIALYCELIRERKLLFRNQDHKHAVLEFFSNHHSLEGVQLIIDLGPGYLHISEYLGRALSYAANAGSIEIVQYLLKIPGTSSTFKNRDGLTPFGLAVQSGHQKIVELLKPLSGGATHQCSLMNDTPLMLALAGCHYDVAEYLLGFHDINVDAHNKLGETALSLAIPDASLEMLKKLFEKQRRYLLAQKQSMTSIYVQSLFFIAANSNRKDFVFFLLDTCGDLINLRLRLPGLEGDNILMHLMRKGPEYNELIKYLIAQPEFELQYKNANQDTLLHHAISYTSEWIVLYLLEKKGADIKYLQPNLQGKNAQALAREKNYQRVVVEIESCKRNNQSLDTPYSQLLFSNQHQNFSQIVMAAAFSK